MGPRSVPWTSVNSPPCAPDPGGAPILSGRPGDGDPRAAYALYDTEARTVTVHRVEYDIAATQALMETAGLPRRLIDRLSVGR